MNTTFEEQGFKDYKYRLHVNPRILEKINDLIDSIKREGAMKGLGKRNTTMEFTATELMMKTA